MSLINDYRLHRENSNSYIKPFFKTMFICCLFFRISNLLYKIKLVPLARLFWLLNRILFAIDIDPRTKIQGGVLILHGAGIVIGKGVEILGNIKIYQGSTIGGNNGKSRFIDKKIFTQPIINDGVTIGINSCLLGPIIIGEKCIIGANALVTKDVPSNSTVISNNKLKGV